MLSVPKRKEMGGLDSQEAGESKTDQSRGAGGDAVRAGSGPPDAHRQPVPGSVRYIGKTGAGGRGDEVD